MVFVRVRFPKCRNAIQTGLQERMENMWLIILVSAFVLVNIVGLALTTAGRREDSKMFRDTTIPEGFDVKNIQPNMDFGKQTRKATVFIIDLLNQGKTDKACYAMDLLNQMLDSIDKGQPQPWSQFFPMFQEEFA